MKIFRARYIPLKTYARTICTYILLRECTRRKVPRSPIHPPPRSGEKSGQVFSSTGIDSRRRIIRYRYRNSISKRHTQGLVTLIADHAHRLTMLPAVQVCQTITACLVRMLALAGCCLLLLARIAGADSRCHGTLFQRSRFSNAADNCCSFTAERPGIMILFSRPLPRGNTRRYILDASLHNSYTIVRRFFFGPEISLGRQFFCAGPLLREHEFFLGRRFV